MVFRFSALFAPLDAELVLMTRQTASPVLGKELTHRSADVLQESGTMK